MNLKLKKNRCILGFIIIVIAITGILFWRHWQISEQKVSKNTSILIGSSAVWNPSGTEWITKWHECKSLDCNLSLMKQDGASLEARNFVKLLPEKGHLKDFQEKGAVDLGMVVFPDRVNTNEEYYLLNGFPTIISTYVSENDLATDGGKPKSAIEKDPLYSEMKAKYSDIELQGEAQEFVEKKILSNNDEEYIFKYNFVNGCRACNTEYSVKIGFIFQSDGEHLGTNFLQINKSSN